MDLNARYKYVTLIISDKTNVLDVKLLEESLKQFASYYAFICHDQDINDSGELKTLHYHIVCETIAKEKHYPRLSTIINLVSGKCNISEFAITINKVTDMVSNVRYLLHLDNKEKHPYSRDALISSDNERTDNYLLSYSDTITTDYLYNLIEETDGSIYLIMREIGVEKYRKYRLVIQDILKSKLIVYK